MNKLMSLRFAGTALLILLSLVVIFHLLIIVQVIPYDIVWGGRLGDPARMQVFELISIAINLMMIGVVGARTGLLKIAASQKLLTVVLWVMTALFLLNTIGNLLSKNEFERMVFTPLTFLLMIFSFRLAWHQD